MTKVDDAGADNDSSLMARAIDACRPYIWIASVVIRVIFLVYGEWQDANFEVPYTDVDYYVYTDAARHVFHGGSPFARHTFRYTPLLAFLLIPCHIIHFSFGKVLFSLMDLLLGWLIDRVLRLRGCSSRVSIMCAAAWLLNPMAFTISTRGNADVVICVMVIATIYLLLKRHLLLASIVFGLSVHFKIYPIIYAAAVLTFLNSDYHARPVSLINRSRLLFFAISATVFLSLLAMFYRLYGWTFVYETYLYHLVRRDNRHNFSPYFYTLYLNFDSPSSVLSGLLTFIPQMLPLTVAALRFGCDLPFAFFVQTVIFVAFNKVSTAQYFIWYWSVLPLLLPYTRATWLRMVFWAIVWFGGELFWLFWAYQLEMNSRPVFTMVWLAGLAFFWANCFLLVDIIVHHKYSANLVAGVVQQSAPK